MANPDSWSDFETMRHNVKQNTVDRLKHILTGFNDECGTVFFKSGKKQELIDRITNQLDSWRQGNNIDKWNRAKVVLHQVRNTGMYSPSRLNSAMAVGAPTIGHNAYTSGSSTKPAVYHTPAAGSSGIGRYDPYAPPRKPVIPVASSSSGSSGPKAPVRFKPSPFFQIDQSVSQVVECPESINASDRKQQSVTFVLNTDQLSKLNSPSSKYQLRLFCTSSAFYSPGPNSFRPNAGPCPIEFPATCEVRVNNVQLSANLKGLKKKPGTAPPADLGKTVRLNNATSNRVEMVYVNSQQPAQPKKFYLVVMLVEITTVDQLVEKMKKGKYRSSNDIVVKMAAAISEDDDIISGPQKMSLKCPLSFMRINTPCRSSQCVHPQCFDATSWFSVMEQTTTWLCPVCERVLNYEDLIIDGYFDEILKQTPDSVEDIMVEADGQWHTSDNKYASADWKASHPPKAAVVLPPPPPKSRSPSKPADTTKKNGKAKANNIEVLVLDSDDEDEDEGRVKRELSPSFGSGSSTMVVNGSKGGAQSHGGDVIDLTLDSDEEEPSVPVRVEKRKASEVALPSPTEQIWKKSRLEPVPPIVMRPANGHPGSGAPASTGSPEAHVNGYTNGLHYSTPHHTSRSPNDPRPAIPPLSPGGRYPPASYAGGLRPSYPPYLSAPRGSPTHGHRGTGAQAYFPPRVNGSSSANINPQWP